MKIALGQINTTPNDFEGNLKEIKDGILTAGMRHADLIVFPELSIPGYLCKDLLYRKGFIEKNTEALAKICELSREFPRLTIVVGYVGKNLHRGGKPFTNMAAAIRDGLVLAYYQKQLLPFYDVFDEGRYFEPGTQPAIIEVAGSRCAITICEDIWNDKGQDNYHYPTNPIDQVRCVDTIINLSSSPYAFGKPEKRLEMLHSVIERKTLVYVNQIGGQDELVFDGRSCILSGREKVFIAPSTKHSRSKIYLVNTDGYTVEELSGQTNLTNWGEQPVTTPVNQLYNSVLLGLRDYITKTGFTEVVLGSSGGIDSAVVAALACDAVGPNNVHCIMMPSIFSSEGSVADAKQLHKNLGCNEYTVPIEHQHLVRSTNSHLDIAKKYHKVADENIQARLRGLTVMHASNAYGFLPLTTGNKTELALGYCTLYGDMDGGFNPIGDLYKDQVYALARHINDTAEIILDKTSGEIIPNAIINKAPSAELAKEQTDQEGLGTTYGFLNAVVRAFVEDHINDFECFKRWWSRGRSSQYPFVSKQDKDDVNHFLKKPNISKDLYYELIRRIDYMEFKRRQAAPNVKVSLVAFGTGRRLPIVQKVG